MAGHTRLYCRGATYYHRAAIPQDIKATHPKSEETFSLGTKDYQETLNNDQQLKEPRRRRHSSVQSPLEEFNSAKTDYVRFFGATDST
ncbi:hypothetical protein ACSSV1_005840 [Labrenzia sp. MBR-25]